MKSRKTTKLNKKIIISALFITCLLILYFGYLKIRRHDAGIILQPELRVKVSSLQKVKAGQKVNYIIEYRNDGLKSATEAIVYFYPDLLLIYKSASHGAYYNNYAHRVSWDLGALPAKSIGYLSVQMEVPLGLPAHLKLDNRAYILDINLKDKENKHSKRIE